MKAVGDSNLMFPIVFINIDVTGMKIPDGPGNKSRKPVTAQVAKEG